MNRLRILCVLIMALVASAGCNEILGNKVFDDLADGGDESNLDATADAKPFDGGHAGVRDATSEATRVGDDGGDANQTDGADGGCGSLTDIHSCGSCTTDCTQFPHVSTTGLGCASGQCTYACSPGFADCADAGTGCGTALSSPSSCGGCGVTCMGATPLCAPSDAGVSACASACSAGETNCSNTCSNLMTDSTHCGMCATACPSSQTCKAGQCQCPTTAAPDACGTACTSKQTDSANCGSCGHACSGGETCQAGVCGCPANQTLCNGTCVNVLGTDVNNCGACGTTCGKLPHVATTGLACTAGKCSYACAAGFADCGNTGTGCNTSLGTATNCSGCGAGCSGGTPVCSPSGSTYACTNGCAAGQTNCSGTCTTTANDPNNCGTCGKVCVGGETCPSGTCVCASAANPNFCGAACTNTQTDTANCGTCSHGCPSVQSCTGGACVCPNSANPTLCGSVCTNTQTDTANCGTCTHACPTAETCQSGTCACPTSANPNFCGTACTNTKTDTNNCGSCSNVCPVAGEQCVNGGCQCPSGTISCNGSCQTPNKCGGCGTITQTLGAACGTCGTYVCSADKTTATCNDPGTTNSCPTWCTSQPAPSGVAASDYQCVDFDNGLPSTSVWSQTVSGATLARSTAQFDSAPASLMTNIPADTTGTAELTWSSPSGGSITSTSVSIEIDPTASPQVVQPSSGIRLIDILTSLNDIYVYFVDESDVQSGYIGLGLHWAYFGSAAVQNDCTLGMTLSTGSWNQLQLSVVGGSSSGISVTLNGAALDSSACSTPIIGGATSEQITVGASGPTVTFAWPAYFDNIQATIRR